MLRKKLALTAVLIVAVTAAVVGVTAWRDIGPSGYTVRVMMASAVGIADGTPVQINGQDVGHVTGVEAKDNKAIVMLSIDDADAPLPSGSRTSVEWRSLLGERFVAVKPGPEGNPPIPDGSLIEASSEQVTVEDLLEALDAPTRKHLKGTLRGLEVALQGRGQDMNSTLRTAGPTVDALGSILDAVGKDGPAIRELVTKLHGVTATLAGRREKLAGVVSDLSTLTDNTVGQQHKLRETLGELPSTLDAAKGTLDQVPPTGKAALPLLHDLRPATARLPAVSNNLKPLLQDLRPTIAELRPTLGSASQLLDHTPGLLDSAHGTVPGLTKAVSTLRPAVAHLRPYTPEIMGFVSGWGNLFSQFDSQGHFAHALVTEGQTSVDNNPPVVTPNMKVDTRGTPGANGGQPWTDATGSGPR